MTAAALRTHTRKQLELMARRSRVAGWHDMSKEELVRALAKTLQVRRRTEAETARSASLSTRLAGTAGRNGAHLPQSARNGARNGATNGHTRRTRAVDAEVGRHPEVIAERQAPVEDSLTAAGMDGRWLHVSWSLSAATLDRARAALAAQWRSAVPVLRLYDATSDDDRGSARTRSGDIAVALEEGHWFVRVGQPGRRWTLELGYRTGDGQFHVLVHSRPVALATDRGDRRRNMNGHGRITPPVTPPAPSVDSLVPKSVSAARRAADSCDREDLPCDWKLSLQAELQIAGRTHPRAEVRAAHRKVPLSSDGRFTLRVPLENGRLVMPADVISPDGAEQRTVVVSVDLNIRELEPQVFDETAE